jgi:hypothetical protein
MCILLRTAFEQEGDAGREMSTRYQDFVNGTSRPARLSTPYLIGISSAGST